MTSIDYARIVAPLDPRVCGNDRNVLETIAGWRYIVSLDECIRAGDITLDGLCRALPRMPKHHVFAAVARLEEFGLIPQSCIR